MLYFKFIKTTRLGNWLFQYAAAMSLSDEVSGYVPCSEMDSAIAEYHEIFGDKIPLIRELPEGVCYCSEKEWTDLCKDITKVVCLNGYFQGERYFNAEKVRAAFAISQSRKEYLMARYGEWLKRPNITGISVRRGDYLKLASRYTPCTMKYYRRCLAMLPECKDFIVCSDDIEWCKREFPKAFPSRRFCFVEREHPLNQLYIQALCVNNVIPNSTFSWWGAYLNEKAYKKILMPKSWFGLIYKMDGNKDDDIFIKGATLVSNRYTALGWLTAYMEYSWMKLKHRLYPIKRYLTVNLV